MKENGRTSVLSVSVRSCYSLSGSGFAARLFDALRFLFFGFIFTRLPIRMKRFA